MPGHFIQFSRGGRESSTNSECISTPLSCHDRIHARMTWDVDTFQKTSLMAYMLNVRIYPLKRGERVYNSNDCFVGFTHYLIEVSGLVSKPVRIRVDEQSDKVYIQAKKCLLTIATFLNNLPPAEDLDMSTPELRQYMLEQQSRWWNINGKKFDLLELPGEIREVIYHHVFETGKPIVPFMHRSVRRRMWNGDHLEIRLPHTKLLRVNKQVREEAGHVLFKYSTFEAPMKQVFSRIVRWALTVDNVRNLEMKMSHFEFFKTFRCHKNFMRPGNPCPAYSTLALRKMKLDNLTISFFPPGKITETLWLDDACQVKIVECIFEGAWQFIRGHPVKFTGYLKASQKADFEERCRSECVSVQKWRAWNPVPDSLEEYDKYLENLDPEEGGGVRLDGRSVDSVALEDHSSHYEGSNASMTHMPPPCHCDTPCTLAGWTEDE